MSNMNVVDYFGPRVAKVTLEPFIVDLLHKICIDSDKKTNHKLVGLIKEENDILEGLKNSNVDKKLCQYVNTYLDSIDSGKYKKVIEGNDTNDYVELHAGWYNKQVQHEYNPPHSHSDSADVVCVIYTKLNISEKPEITYETNLGKDHKHNGKLFFDYGWPEKNNFNKKVIEVNPSEGDMYIFPSSLTHYTEPVLGKDDYRYSISCNFIISESVKFMTSAMERDKQ